MEGKREYCRRGDGMPQRLRETERLGDDQSPEVRPDMQKKRVLCGLVQ